MPFMLKLVICFGLFSVVMGVINFEGRIVMFGTVMGDETSLFVRVFFVVVHTLLIVGMMLRSRLAAIFYCVWIVVGGVYTFANALLLEDEGIKSMTGIAPKLLPWFLAVGLLSASILLALPVFWHRHYFNRK